MTSFEELHQMALARKGGALAERFRDPLDADALSRTTDDRWLSAMTQRVFSAGFVWRVIEAKWDGFETAFEGFDPVAVSEYGVDEIEALRQDTRIVRNPQKIKSTVDNARFVLDVAREHGSFGRWVAQWPDDDLVGLYKQLGKRGSRLGGMTGQYLLRFMGKDAFMLTKDVTAALVREGVVAKAVTSQRDLAAAQAAFNAWKAESGRPFNHISVVLACTVEG